jgi:hypothetical protein
MKLPRAILFDLDDTILLAFGPAQSQWQRTIAAFADQLGPLETTMIAAAIEAASTEFLKGDDGLGLFVFGGSSAISFIRRRMNSKSSATRKRAVMGFLREPERAISRRGAAPVTVAILCKRLGSICFGILNFGSGVMSLLHCQRDQVIIGWVDLGGPSRGQFPPAAFHGSSSIASSLPLVGKRTRAPF